MHGPQHDVRESEPTLKFALQLTAAAAPAGAGVARASDFYMSDLNQATTKAPPLQTQPAERFGFELAIDGIQFRTRTRHP